MENKLTDQDIILLKLAGEIEDMKKIIGDLSIQVSELKVNQTAHVEQSRRDRKRARNLAGYAYVMGRMN